MVSVCEDGTVEFISCTVMVIIIRWNFIVFYHQLFINFMVEFVLLSRYTFEFMQGGNPNVPHTFSMMNWMFMQLVTLEGVRYFIFLQDGMIINTLI